MSKYKSIFRFVWRHIESDEAIRWNPEVELPQVISNNFHHKYNILYDSDQDRSLITHDGKTIDIPEELQIPISQLAYQINKLKPEWEESEDIDL